ncbi:unnamed protein product [Penicillium glandicola]
MGWRWFMIAMGDIAMIMFVGRYNRGLLLSSTIATISNALLGWKCAFNFMSLMYAVLYAYTPEIFLTKDRGTGNALTASTNRIFGIMAPIAIFADLTTAAPVYVSGALFVAVGILVLFMPYEPHGKLSL